jgi:hypothetical protein
MTAKKKDPLKPPQEPSVFRKMSVAESRRSILETLDMSHSQQEARRRFSMTAKKKDPLKPPYHYDFKEAKKNLITEEEQFVYQFHLVVEVVPGELDDFDAEQPLEMLRQFASAEIVQASRCPKANSYFHKEDVDS